MSLHHCNDLAKVKALLASKADPNAYDIKGNTPLMYCQDTKILTALVNGKADVNKQCKNAYTPIFVSSNNSIEYLSLLLSYKADPNVNNPSWNAVHHFCYSQSPLPRHIQLVIDHGADIHHHDSRGYTPLNLCSHPDNMKVLLDNKADPNECNNDHKIVPLMSILFLGRTKNPYPLASLLLAYNANINHSDVNGRTAIWLSNDIKTTQLLIDNKATVNHIDNNGYNILSSQYIKSHDIARLLIKNNADAKHLTREHMYSTIMTSLTQPKSPQYIKVLIDNNADLHHISPTDGCTLWAMSDQMSIDCLKFILQSKADPNLRDRKGLHSLYYVNTIEKVRLLLQYKADGNISPYDNDNTLITDDDLSIDIRRLLIEHKANVNHIFDDGYPVLTHSHNYETTKLLIDSKADLTWVHSKIRMSMLHLALLIQSTWTPDNYLLSVKPCNNDPKYPDGHCKVYGGYLNIIEKILKAKVDPNLQPGKDGYGPYHYTIDPDIRKLLVKYGATPVDGDPVITTSSGVTITKDNINDPIDDDNNTYIFTELLTYRIPQLISMNANIDATNKYDYTPLMVAKDCHHFRTLIMYKANIHHRSTYDGTTVLHHAPRKDIYDMLINAKADPNIVDFKGNKPSRDKPAVRHTFPKYNDDQNDNNDDQNDDQSDDNKANKADDDTTDDNSNTYIKSNITTNTNTHTLTKIDQHKYDDDGYTPLHNAQFGDRVRLLPENKGNAMIRRNETGNTPLHMTLKSDVIIALLDAHADINASSREIHTPLHYISHSECDDPFN